MMTLYFVQYKKINISQIYETMGKTNFFYKYVIETTIKLGLSGIWLNVPISSLLPSLICILLLYIYLKQKKVLDNIH